MERTLFEKLDMSGAEHQAVDRRGMTGGVPASVAHANGPPRIPQFATARTL